MSDRFDLSEKVAVVTGGAGLIGSAISHGLADHGAHVVVVDADDDAGRTVESSIGDRGQFIQADLRETAEVDTVFETIYREHGGLDILVNSAYPRNERYGRRYEQVTIEDFRENVTSNLDSLYLPIRRGVALMRKGGGGSIVNIGSIYGFKAPDFSVYENTDMTSPVEYAAVKGAVLNLTRYLASYFGADGVRVNAISPGGVYDDQDETFIENYKRRTPLGRMARPDDVVGAVVFLSSDASDYVTGHNLVVDGGWTVR